MNTITDIRATTIPDSRGKPTLAVTVMAGNAQGTFSDPSGASTGSHEARELRDADGGEQIEIVHVEQDIRPALIGMDVADQSGIDAKMIALDGTPDKSRLGGNALIGVSIAAAKAAAAAKGVRTFEHLRTLADIAPSRRVPLLYMNYINGGKHAKSPLSFQEHLIVPDTESVAESLSMANDIGAQLEILISEKYGADVAGGMGDEGGYVIPEHDALVPFELLVSAIEQAGYAGRVHIATDVAASSFYADGAYDVGGKKYSPDELLALHKDIAARFPVISIEDPFEENSSANFARLQQSVPARIVGDDLTVTSAERIREAAKTGAIRAVIIKPNQVGTLTETLAAMRAARENNIDCIVSHRSGETMDDFVADLAYAFGCFGLKSGAPRKPERIVKYERLQAISTL